MVLEISVKLCVTAGFSRKKNFVLKIGKVDQNWAKNSGFFNLLKNLVIFLLNLFYNENLYYLLCSCINPIFGKIFVPEI